jgi:hypothetical protein
MRASHLSIVAALLVVATVADAQLTIRPGDYHVEYQMDLGPARSADAKALAEAAGLQNQRQCITADDVRDQDYLKLLAAQAAEEHCTISDRKTTGNTLTFTMTCEEDGERTTTTSEMTFGADGFSALAKAKSSDGLVVEMKIRAKRIGECRQ